MPSKPYSLKGGLHLSESPLDIYPGYIRDSLNYYESPDEGYERVGGFERYDGQPAPSDDTYYVCVFDNWSSHVTDISAGTTITVDSTLTFRVLDTEDDLENDQLKVYASYLVGTIPDDLDTTPLTWDAGSDMLSITPRDADTDALDEYYLELAWDYARSLINVVPCSDAPAGICQIDDRVVAFGNDSGSPKAYYSSAAGWVEAKIGRVAEITGYTAGDVLPGETIDSGNFVVLAVCEWYDTAGVASSTKAWFVLAPTSASTAPATGAATASGGASFTIASVIQPIGAFGDYIEYKNHNFLANPDGLSSWIADGAQMMLCYSAAYDCLLPVASNYNDYSTEVVTDIEVHGDKLIGATGAGTFIMSEPDSPFNYGGTYGAAEIGVGDFIKDMVSADSEHMIVFTKKGAKKLLGDDSTSWDFKNAASTVGSYFRGAQKLDDIFSFSARGVASLVRTETTGGYNGGQVSAHIQDLINGFREKLKCSTVLPSKEQIRWYFNDGHFLMMTRLPSDDGTLRHSFGLGYHGDIAINGICTDVWSDGSEHTFFITDDGYVYEDEKGSNFDGEAIYSFIELHSNHLRTPGNNKSFKRMFLEAKSQNTVTLTVSFLLDYGQKIFLPRETTVYGGRGSYDVALYDEGTYNASDRDRNKIGLKGKGWTIGFVIENSSKFALPFKITGYTLEYEMLGKAIK